jgi:hypothetical protein
MYLVADLVISHLPVARGSLSSRILIAAPWLTWPVMLSEMANGWWGARNMPPIAATQAGASGAAGWQEGIVTAAHLLGALVLVAYWGIILVGLFRKPPV